MAEELKAVAEDQKTMKKKLRLVFKEVVDVAEEQKTLKKTIKRTKEEPSAASINCEIFPLKTIEDLNSLEENLKEDQ